MSKTSKLSSAFKILWEALIILTKTWRSLLPIMFINLLFSTLFFLLNYLSITSILTEVTGGLVSLSIIDSKSSEYASILSTIRKDLREITTIEAIILVASFIVSSFITTTTIHLISTACSEKKKQTPQELFSVIKKIWKGPMLTQLFATILNIAVSFFILIIVIAFIMISIGSFGYTAAGVLLAILGMILCLYVALICSLSIVVSVVEEGCYGVAAFERSVELTKGRRQIGILIMFVTVVGCGINITAFNYLSVLYASSNIFVRLVIGFAYVAMLVMMTVLINAANTVFYYECKSNGSTGGLLALPMEGALGYTSVSKEADTSIP